MAIMIRVDLSPSAAKKLHEMCEKFALGPSDIVERAIITESYLQQKKAEGAKVLIDDGESLKEVIFQGGT